MLKFVISILLVSFGITAAAQDHSENVCSSVDATVCAHLGHMTALNSRDEVQFVAHVMLPASKPVTNMQVQLWMPEMGHGSSPVKLTQIDVNKYQVSEAFFIMAGKWVVRMKFTLNDVNHEINVPVIVPQ